jgi:crotonobetainyl-CoA:carnitine CoA-transferase CaiB-like acyl-CoA transferase
VRVLDAAAPHGQYCGKLLADLGADVVKLEVPEGDPGRSQVPLSASGESLFWAYYNSNKRSVTRPSDVEPLVRWADVLITTDQDLSFAQFATVNPRLILTTISPFGDGPYRDYPATSQSVFAMSGIMKTIGPPARPPAAAPGQLPFDLASTDAASGVVAALLMRLRSGVGQHVQVAALDVLAAQVNPRPREQYVDARFERIYNPTLAPGGTFQCLDGAVELTIVLLGHWQGLKELIGNPPKISGPEWNDRSFREAHAAHLGEIVAAAFASRCQADVVEQAQRLRVPCGPVNTTASFAVDRQIEARGFFVDTISPGLGQHKTAGAPFKLSNHAWQLRRSAPRLGEHTREVLDDAATHGDSTTFRATALAEAPLSGVRVLSFTTAFAGPTAARYLADLGADVIKVESRRRWDNTRHSSSAGTGGRAEPSGAPTAPGFAYFNRNTRGVAIDLSLEEGQALIRRLVGLCDVVVENFSYRVMRNWGLGYDELKVIKADVILLDMQGMGASGPLKDYLSFGPTLHSYSGLTSLWGYSHSSFVDYVAAQHAVFAVLAAILRRRQIGNGLHIDMAQLEAAAATLGVPYLDYFVNGVVERFGDYRLVQDAPSGCCACMGEDAWCVVDVGSDDQWLRLRRAMGDPSWAGDPELATQSGGRKRRDDIDRRLGEWTRTSPAAELERRLLGAGVPAGAVRPAWDVFEDPHLLARSSYWDIEHPVLGKWRYPGLTIRLSGAPSPPRRPAPLLGQDNEYVFGELLGLPQDELARLADAGVLS